VRSNKVTKWFRQRTINFNQWASWNYDGNLQYAGANINGNVTLLNNWQMGAGTFWPLPRRGLDDRMTRGGPAVITEGSPEGWFWIYSDGRRKFSAGLEGDWGADNHNSSWQAGIVITLRRSPRNVSPSPCSSTQPSGLAVGQQRHRAKTHYVFAHIDQPVNRRTGGDGSQPRSFRRRYSAFKEVNDPHSGPRKPLSAVRVHTISAGTRLQREVVPPTSMLRWEYKPGSALFVVWQQAARISPCPAASTAATSTASSALRRRTPLRQALSPATRPPTTT
jgi:hypothetical protein